MRDILISSTVCVLCLLLALVSQLVAPSTVAAAALLVARFASPSRRKLPQLFRHGFARVLQKANQVW